eukprot:504891_1
MIQCTNKSVGNSIITGWCYLLLALLLPLQEDGNQRSNCCGSSPARSRMVAYRSKMSVPGQILSNPPHSAGISPYLHFIFHSSQYCNATTHSSCTSYSSHNSK